MSNSSPIKEDTILRLFFDRHPNFDLLSFNFFDVNAVEALNWQGLDQSTILDLLKKYQRLLRLHPDPAVATALLNPSLPQTLKLASATVETQPIALAVSDAQPKPSLDSAHAIAAIPEAQFVQDYGASVGGEAVAREIHQNATAVKAKTMHLWANTHNLVASPHFRAMLTNNVGDDIHQFENFPNYQELFGSLDFCECEQCQSIFSPAAYFVDLMRLTEESITTKNNIDARFTLNARRPDLAQIPLTCEKTNDLVPYLDIVNKVVALKVDGLNSPSQTSTPEEQAIDRAYKFLATATYPFNLPFNLPLEQIRSYLRQLNTNLASIYKTFNASDIAIARETLGLSIEEYNLITTPKTTAPDLSRVYGVDVSGSNLGGLINPDTFLQQTGLSRQELHDLLYQNLSQEELAPGLAHNFYINQVLASGQYLRIIDDSNTIINLDLTTIDRINRFVRLAKKLNWSFADLDWVLTSIGITGTKDIDQDAIQKIAQIKQLQAKLNLPLDVLCSLWYDIKTIGVGDSKNSQALFDAIFNNPQLLRGKPPYHPAYSVNPLYTDAVLKISDANSKIAAGLRASLDDLTALVKAFWNNANTIDLNVQNLSAFYRHTKLASLLRLPIDQYLLLLRLINKQSQVFSIQDIINILDSVAWLNNSGFNIYELDYILNGNESEFVDKKYKDENIQPFLESLWALSISPQPELKVSDILDWSGFVSKLNQPEQNNPNPNRRLWNLFSSEVQQAITAIGKDIKNLTEEGKSTIVQALNTIFKRPDFYQEAEFSNVEGAEEIKKLLLSREVLSQNEIQKLNRLLLELSYPQEIAKGNIKKIGDEWKDKLIEQLANFLGGTTDVIKEIIDFIARLQSPILFSINDSANDDFLKSLNQGIVSDGLHKILQENGIKLSNSHTVLVEQESSKWLISAPDSYSTYAVIKSKNEEHKLDICTPNLVDALLNQSNTQNNPNLNYIKQVIVTLSKGLVLNQKLQLTQSEIDSVISHPDCYGIAADFQQINIDNIKSLYTFKQLTKAFKDTQDELIQYFAELCDKTNPDKAIQLATITGWEQNQIEELAQGQFNGVSNLYNSVEGIAKLKSAFDLSNFLGVNISFHSNLIDLATKSVDNDADWPAYNNTAQSITEIVKAKYNDDDWTKISEKLNGTLNELKRNALTGFALWKLNQQDQSFKSLRNLSEYLLIDVETTGCASISYIKQAILSMQMYLQRCRINLEPGVLNVNIPEVWWEWMMNYRVWEANRKVFLYPENYIEPNLRKNKSDLFKELEAELLQSDITQESVEAAYQNYFDKFAELAKLRIAASYRCFVKQPNSPDPVDMLFVFGRTATEPYTYYYRECINPTAKSPIWNSWSKIDIHINSDYISPAFAFNKLFVFWVETIQTTSSSSGDSSQKTTVQKATIKYTFQTVSKRWVQPQTLAKDIVIKVEGSDYSPPGIDIDLDTTKLFWKKVYPLTLHAKGSEPEKVLILFGDIPSLPTIEPQKNSERDKNATLIEFETQIYEALVKGYCAYQNKTQGYISLVPATTLTSDLLIENEPLILKMGWSTAKLSQARFNIAATTVGNLAMFAGGAYDNYNSRDVVDIYCYINNINYLCDNYISDSIRTSTDKQSSVDKLASQFGLKNISKANSSVLTVKNQPGWFTFDNGDEAFLVILQAYYPFKPISYGFSEVQFDDSLGGLKLELELLHDNDVFQAAQNQYSFTRLTTSTIRQLSQKAFIGGIDHLLDLDSQLTPELDFTRFNPSNSVIPPASKTLDFQGSYGLYFQELFFHIPFLVANTLNANQRFAEAQKWYHYIFNPTQQNQQSSQGLVGYWSLNEESGTTIHAQTGSNNGILQGKANWQTAADFPGSSRSLLQFDGTSNYIEVSYNQQLNPDKFTISCWVKVEGGTGTIRSPLTSRDVTNNNCTGYLLYAGDNNKWQVWVGNGTAQWQSITGTDVILNTWTHVSATYDGSNLKLYINGKLEGTLATSYVPNTSRPLRIGAGSTEGTPQYFFLGQIADVSIWDVALSAEQILENASEYSSDRFWRYLPFRGNTLEKLKAILTNDQAIAAYNNDPFDPHAIAQLRIGAYEKAIVMKYIDNLLDWGDNLFAQDTWESITQATMLYLLAYDLLGSKPENLGKCKLPAPETFEDIKKQYNDNIPQFLIELEQHLGNGQGSTLNSTPFNDINAYFCVSENEQFTAYWDRVEDRLYKIRHCQNIEGVVRQLALFEPPIDPNQLVRAVAAGNVPMSVVSGLTAEVPHYRFDYMLERAKNITSTLIQLGSSLLSALEKKDAEQISLLRATQESAILQLIQTTKEKQITEAQGNLDSLKKSLDAASNRVTHYQNLMNGGWNAAEISSVTLAGIAIEIESAATEFNILAAPAYLVPNIYGLADGGMNFGAAVATIGAALSGIASTLNQGSSLAATIAQYQRREEDWQLQLQMAQDDVALITQQIAASQINVDIAISELNAHQKSIEQADEVEDFFKNKFSNQDLYQWMVNRLSVLYFQTFKIALDMALSAQKAYQYELNQDDTYISFDYWDSLKKGLLAGEGLMLGLNQLEKAFIEGNERRMEIDKTISLLQLNPQAFQQLKDTGKCQFELSEKLFDYDFPGHYCRQIKTISISIPAVVGPYQNIKATLTQLSDRTLIAADSNAVKYLLGQKDSTQPDTSTLRSSWRRNQKIALSKGVNDTGLFELNFRDERYLPFEGTGAVSTWELSLPKSTNRIDFDSLSDVIINLSYTALDAGDGEFKQAVQKALQPYEGAYYLSLNQAFPGAWQAFVNSKTNPNSQQLKFSISENIIPPHIMNTNLTKILFKLDVSDGTNTSASFISLKIGEENPISINLQSNSATLDLITAQKPTGLTTQNLAVDWIIDVDLKKAPDNLKQNGFLNLEVVKNIELILVYQGDISWEN